MVAALISCDYNVYNINIIDYEKQNIINENLVIIPARSAPHFDFQLKIKISINTSKK